MALQRPRDDRGRDESATTRPQLRLVHSADRVLTPEEAAATFSEPTSDLARGVMWGLLISVAGFWAPLAAVVAYLLRNN